VYWRNSDNMFVGFGDAGASLIEILVSLSLVVMFMAATLPLSGAGGGGLLRLAELGLRGSSAGIGAPSAKLRTVAWSSLASELHFYGSLAHTQLRDAATCPLPGAPSPIRAERTLPRDGYLPGEPEVPPSLGRVVVRLSDESTIVAVPGECPLRRIVVQLFLEGTNEPFTEGVWYKSEP